MTNDPNERKHDFEDLDRNEDSEDALDHADSLDELADEELGGEG